MQAATATSRISCSLYSNGMKDFGENFGGNNLQFSTLGFRIPRSKNLLTWQIAATAESEKELETAVSDSDILKDKVLGDKYLEEEGEEEGESDDVEDMRELGLGEKEQLKEASFLAEYLEKDVTEDFEREAKLLAKALKETSLQEIPADEEVSKKGKEKSQRRSSKSIITSKVPDNLLPKVAIIGRPNVGKSALFNRIAGRNIAIVYDEPGVTRDRLYMRADWINHDFLLADTGGVLTPPITQGGSGGVSDAIAITRPGGSQAVTQALKEAAAAGLPAMIEKQAAQAVEEAAAIIFVVDGKTGVTAADEEIASWLRRKYEGKKHITMAVNKCESPTRGALQASEFWALGFTPFPVSAITGTGTGDLLDDVCAELPSPKAEDEVEDDEDNRPLAIAITGRPNVGKSSILNALVGEQRSIVSPLSGTTRDAIDSEFVGPDGQEYTLIDTAGIRRRAAVAAANSKTESLSVNRAFRAIRRADVVALVIDAMECVTEQDFRLGERIAEEGKAAVIVVNKWDTIPEKDNSSTLQYTLDVRERLRCLDWAPIIFTSATVGQRIPKILAEARKAGGERAKRLSTAVLNPVVQEALTFKQPPSGKAGKRGRVYYCTQAAVRPPTFVFFVNDAKLFSELYRRYMEKQIRKNVGFPGTPIRLLWRSKKKSERRVSKSSKGE